MSSDGPRGPGPASSDHYSSLLREKRSQHSKVTPTPKHLPVLPIPSGSAAAEDLTDQNGGTAWRPSLTDTLQLTLGRRVVEVGELTVKVLQLESTAAQWNFDFERKCRELERCQISLATQQEELLRTQTRADDLTMILNGANAKLTAIELRHVFAKNK